MGRLSQADDRSHLRICTTERPQENLTPAEVSTRHAQFRVEQNYKTAVPQYYWPKDKPDDAGKLHLLLPLCLQDVSRADLALSVDRVGGA